MLHQRNKELVSSEIRDTLGQYDLLIPIILRLVKRGASLEQTIEEQIDLDHKKMFTLRYMMKNTEKTVFVLDGLDEFKTKTRSDITDIMKGNTFKHVIITSRAEAANKTKDWKQIMYKEAELKGFSDKHIKLYVDKFFKTSKDLAISLKSYIFQKDSNLLELARNPGSLCMLCILHKDKIQIHAMNREQLYEEYVAFLLSRWEQRQNPEGEKTSRSEVLKKYHEILLKFGELSIMNRKPYDAAVEYKHKSDDEDSMELSFTMEEINSIKVKDALNLGFIYKSHPSSRLLSSRYSFLHKTVCEYFMAYFISHTDINSFKQRLYKNRDLLEHELSLTRFLLHLYMTAEEAYKFTSNIIGSDPDMNKFKFLHDLYTGYQHDEYQRTLTFSTTGYYREYSYIYQYPCYVIHAERRHQDLLSSYNKDMIRSMNIDNKHKALTVPLLQTASQQVITCGDSWYGCDFYVYCRPDYEVTVTGVGSKLEELCLRNIEKMGDINLDPVNDRLKVIIQDTNLHGCVGLNKHWMALIQSLTMRGCKIEADDISVLADSIQACTSPTGAESASPCRLQKLDLFGNSLTGAGSDIARIIMLCTEINLGRCKLESGDISVIADSIQVCASSTGAESASPCSLQKLSLEFNSLTGAGADIVRIIKCIRLCKYINLDGCDLNDEDFHDIVIAVTQTHSARHTSVHDNGTPDRRQTTRIKPESPGPASHIEVLLLHDNKFSDVKTVRLLLDNLPPSLHELWLFYNQFNKEETQEIRRTYKDKHPNLILQI